MAAAFNVALLGYACTPGAVYLASLTRFMDSNTLVTSAGLGNNVVSCPVLTRPLLSRELSTTVGCAAAMTMVGGAIELPPDTELFEPIKIEQTAARAELINAVHGIVRIGVRVVLR